MSIQTHSYQIPVVNTENILEKKKKPSCPNCLVSVLPPEETLLQCTDLASCVRLLKPEHLNTGLELIRRIQERLVAILQHSTQVRPGLAQHTCTQMRQVSTQVNTPAHR